MDSLVHDQGRSGRMFSGDSRMQQLAASLASGNGRGQVLHPIVFLITVAVVFITGVRLERAENKQKREVRSGMGKVRV